MRDPATLEKVVAHLADDGFIAYPTETVWGLGACADRPRAIARILDWKGRSENAPMSLLVGSLADAEALGCVIPASARVLAERFWPGPVTLVVPTEPAAQRFAPGIAGQSGALGLRCSTHPWSMAIAEALSKAGLGPITSTSLNRTGEPPAANFAAAQAMLGSDSSGAGEAPLLVGDAVSDAGGETPSTVVDCVGVAIRILREGAVPKGEIDAALAAASESAGA